MVGGGGDPSDFFAKNPAWNRLTLGLISNDGSGACGIGDEPRESFETSSERYDGSAGSATFCSADETSGVEFCFCGVFSNSARAPESVSSRHRTLRFLGVKDIPFLPATTFLRRGEDFIGDEKTCGATAARGGMAIGAACEGA